MHGPSEIDEESLVRKRRLTEKGEGHKLEVLGKQRKAAQKAVRKRIEETVRLLEDGDRQEVIEKSTELDRKFTEFLEACSKQQEMMTHEERKEDDRKINGFDKEIYEHKKAIHLWLQRGDRNTTRSVKSKSSKRTSKSSTRSSKPSTRSSKSSSKYLRERMTDEKTKLAELQIEADYLEKQNEVELQSKRVQIDLEMAKTTAKLRILSDAECQEVQVEKGFVDKIEDQIRCTDRPYRVQEDKLDDQTRCNELPYIFQDEKLDDKTILKDITYRLQEEKLDDQTRSKESPYIFQEEKLVEKTCDKDTPYRLQDKRLGDQSKCIRYTNQTPRRKDRRSD